MTEAIRPYIDKLQTRSLAVGVVGLALTAVGLVMGSMEQVLRSYLIAFIMWGGVALGCLGLLMLHHMVGGGWGVTIRRSLEAGTRTLPLVALLFLPVAFGLHSLYEWSHADIVAKSEELQHKALWLNPTGFYIRAVIYFLIWMFLASRLNGLTARQEKEGYWPVRPSLQRVSAPGLIVHCLVVTFAAIDWVMSLEPHWYSTMYGPIFIVNQALSTFAVMIFVICYLSTKDPMRGTVKSQAYLDLGTLMFAFNMLWAYVCFSQFLIIWSANLPEEISYYTRRMRGGWDNFGLFVFLVHFVLIFVLLLNKSIKRNPKQLAMVAALMVVMRVCDLIWTIQPGFSHGKEDGVFMAHMDLTWWHLFAPIGVGGLWLAFFANQLKKRSIEPLTLT